jgi:hypothetical protein
MEINIGSKYFYYNIMVLDVKIAVNNLFDGFLE